LVKWKKKEMIMQQAIRDRLVGMPEGKDKEKLWKELQGSIKNNKK
jgi:hypothetical protein